MTPNRVYKLQKDLRSSITWTYRKMFELYSAQGNPKMAIRVNKYLNDFERNTGDCTLVYLENLDKNLKLGLQYLEINNNV